MSRDPFEDVFAQGVPDAPTPEEARTHLAELTPGFRRARARHRARVGLAATAAAVVLVAGGSGIVASISDGQAPSSLDAAAEIDAVPSTGDTTEITSDPREADGGTETGDASTPATGAPDAGSAPGDSIDESAAVTDVATPDEATGSDSTSASREIGETTGGWAIVDLIDGSLVLVDHEAAAGFTAAVKENEPSEIKIEFSDEQVEYEVGFKIEDGEIVVRVEQHDRSESDEPESDESEPDESESGDSESDESDSEESGSEHPESDHSDSGS